MDITPSALEGEFSLATAVTRLEFLSRRDSGATELNTVAADQDDDWSSLKATGTSLDAHESLELLALGEVVARKAHQSRLTGIRAALREGASWEQIAAALETTPGVAWDIYRGLVQDGYPDEDAGAAARELAGSRPAG